MSTGVVGQLITHTCTFRNPDGSPVTGKVANISAYLKRAKQGATVLTFPTLSSYAEVGSSGTYEATFTATQDGKYYIVSRYSEAGQPIQDYDESFDVITAAQADPAAAMATDLDAIKAKTDVLGTGRQIVATSPVSADSQTVTLVKGDAYSALPFTEPSGGPAWPVLTGLTPKLILTNRVNAVVLSLDGTVTTATGSAKAVSFALNSNQTAALAVGKTGYRFAVHLPTLNTTLVRGAVTVERDAAP